MIHFGIDALRWTSMIEGLEVFPSHCMALMLKVLCSCIDINYQVQQIIRVLLPFPAPTANTRNFVNWF